MPGAALLAAAALWATPCPPLAHAATLPVRAAGSSLAADVDGDGRPELVQIRLEPTSPPRCGFFLVARRRREWAVRVPESFAADDSTTSRWSLSEPYVALAVRIVPGRDAILVVRHHGASVVFGSLYGVVDSRLVELRFPNPWTSVALYGSVGHYSMFDCRGPRTIMASGMGYLQGRRPYAVEQKLYRLRGSRFVQVHRWTTRLTPTAERRWARRWLDGKPFASCATAHSKIALS